jgi:hypothetical protein
MRMGVTGVLFGLGSALALVVVSAADASAGCRRVRACRGYAPPPVYQYAPPPQVYYVPPPAYYGPAPVQTGYAYAPPPAYGPTYGYAPAAGYNGYRNCNRGYGYAGYGHGYGYAPPAAYDDDDYRPAAVWVPVR